MDTTQATTDSSELTADEIASSLEQAPDEEENFEQLIEAELSKLPRVNLGALFMPAVWGPAHGQWVTIFFYPIWLLADNCITNAVLYGGIAIVFAVLVILGTTWATYFYASTAGKPAYLRVAHKKTTEEYLAQERIWTVVSALIALVFIGLATWYNLAVRLPAGPAF